MYVLWHNCLLNVHSDFDELNKIIEVIGSPQPSLIIKMESKHVSTHMFYRSTLASYVGCPSVAMILHLVLKWKCLGLMIGC